MIITFHITIQSFKAVTYLEDSEWGGRLGDKLMMYIKAKYVAYKLNIPFYIKHFSYIDSLKIHDLETYLPPQKGIKQIRDIKSMPSINAHENAIYIIHYYFQLPTWGKYQELYDSQEISLWDEIINDPIFINQLKQTISPRKSINLCPVPSDNSVKVALHIRQGGGFDIPLYSRQLYDKAQLKNAVQVACPEHFGRKKYADSAWPLKFPPLQFYIDQIRYLAELLHYQPMYIHIFTDHSEPELLVKTLHEQLALENIWFGFRKEDNHHSQNILEDLFSMTQFEYLIRSGSNLPQIAQLIGNFKLTIYPHEAAWIDDMLVVTNVGIVDNRNTKQYLLSSTLISPYTLEPIISE